MSLIVLPIFAHARFRIRPSQHRLGPQCLWLDHLGAALHAYGSSDHRLGRHAGADGPDAYATRLKGRRFVDTSENALYWHFIVISWVFVYAVIYWVPRLRDERLRPWAGWIGGIAGWFVSQQSGRSSTSSIASAAHGGCWRSARSAHCWRYRGGLHIVAGLAGARKPRPALCRQRRFVAGDRRTGRGIFLLAILFQTLASLIIPRCHA
jgi:hypothetical protein